MKAHIGVVATSGLVHTVGVTQARSSGIAKNGAQVFALLALANLFLARRRLNCG